MVILSYTSIYFHIHNIYNKDLDIHYFKKN